MPFPEAADDALPAVLVTPPWLDRVPRPAVVIEHPPPPVEAEIRWDDGERDLWAQGGLGYVGYQTLRGFTTWHDTASLLTSGKLTAVEAILFFARGDPAVTEPLLSSWQPGQVGGWERWLRMIAVRHGLGAHRPVVRFARKTPAAAPILMPFASAEIALLAAEWAVRLTSVRDTANAWLLRHPDVAARALIPDAVGKPGPARRAAEAALRTIAEGGHRGGITETAKAHGETVAAAIEVVIAADPSWALPAKMPTLPPWAKPALPSTIRLRARSAILPQRSVGYLCSMLAVSASTPYAGVAIVKDACNRADLAEFGWTLFTQWQRMGAPSKESWALRALGLIGDDETVRRLSPIIGAWPGEGAHARAVAGLDVLAAIGSDVALTHLHRISQDAKFKGLRDRAAERVEELAETLYPTSEPEPLAAVECR